MVSDPTYQFRKKELVALILLTVAISSCAHYYYVPNTPDVPLFTEKNEFRGSISCGGGEAYSSAGIQGAYSLTDHIAAMTNLMLSNGGYFYERNKANINCLDGAIGYFQPFNEFMVFEVFGGIGMGSQHHEYYLTDYEGTSKLSFTKTYLQPSLGMTFKAFDIALSTSITRLNFNRIVNDISSPSNSTSDFYNQLNLLDHNKQSLLFEPAFTFRAGWEYVKFQVQYVYSINLIRNDLNFEKSKMTVGLSFSIAKKYANSVIRNQLSVKKE